MEIYFMECRRGKEDLTSELQTLFTRFIIDAFSGAFLNILCFRVL